jgi:hypothetical protein
MARPRRNGMEAMRNPSISDHLKAAAHHRRERVNFDRWQTAPNLEVLNLSCGAERPVPRRQSGFSRP